MRKIRSLFKQAVGLSWFASPSGRASLRRRDCILTLHRVLASDAEAALPHRRALCIGAGAFERLLVWLSRNFDCVSLEELLGERAGVRPRLALSFDDGWRDNAEVAFPLLKRYQIPASVFLATDYIGTDKRFWWEALGETFWQRPHEATALMQALAGLNLTVPPALCIPAPTAERSRAIGRFLQQLKPLPAQTLDELTRYCPAQGPRDALDWQQVEDMEASGLVRFGSHGAGHAILTQLDKPALEDDLRRAASALVRHCKAPLGVFCYPNGNHDAQVRAAVSAHGYRYALASQPGLLGHDSSPLALPRIDVSHEAAVNPALLSWCLFQGARR